VALKEIEDRNKCAGEGHQQFNRPKLVENCCSRGRGQLGNLEEGERPSLEAVVKKLVKARQAGKT
jgi:hypothetical protein